VSYSSEVQQRVMSAGGGTLTGTVEPLDLIVLDDGVQCVAVRLLSATPQNDYYDAEIVIRSDFVNATVRTGFNADDLDIPAFLRDRR